MKRKLLPASSASASAAAILAGGVLFSGPASATIIFSEGFEGPTNAFGMSTYAYSQNYTMPNPFGGDLRYATCGAGVNGQVSTNVFQLPRLSLTAGSGVSSGQIDSGSASYDFRSDFSTYRFQGDYAQISITFKNAADSPVGTPIVLGGQAFSAALASGQFGNYPDARAWGESAMQGIVPAGARQLEVTLSGTKTAGGTAIDGYVDNVSFAVAVPEPATFVMGAFGVVVCLHRRRRPPLAAAGAKT
jgi:hypothetical protein